MATNTFKINEAEGYLLRNWKQARLVKDSMEKILTRYHSLCGNVLDTLQERHKGLDYRESFSRKGNGTELAVGRERWKTNGNYAYIGVDYVDLDSLLDFENPERPFIGIWTGEPKKPAMSTEQVSHLCAAARGILTDEQLSECDSGGDFDEYCYQVWYSLPDRAQLLKMLLEEGGQRFVECLVDNFEVFAKCIPVLDEIFPKPKKR
jgi:hypothetical protein